MDSAGSGRIHQTQFYCENMYESRCSNCSSASDRRPLQTRPDLKPSSRLKVVSVLITSAVALCIRAASRLVVTRLVSLYSAIVMPRSSVVLFLTFAVA